MLEVLKNDPEKVFRGIDLAAEAIRAEDKLLNLPGGEDALAESLKETAESHDMAVELGIVNKRANSGKALILVYQMYKSEAAELAVEEAGITNGVVKMLTSHSCVVAETEKRVAASRAQSCGKCIEVCEESAILQTSGRLPQLPTKLTKVGKFKR